MSKKFKNIQTALKTATGCLLGATSLAQASPGIAGWDTDVAILIYNEQDRVSAIEPAISIKKEFDDESAVGFKLVLDSLTGASHNGAAQSDEIQTFSRPSGNGSYTTGVGEVPLDDTFRDTRINFSANYLQPINRLNRLMWTANVSNEYDFFSLGGSGTWLTDLNQRNTTLSLGLSFESNQIKPVGGTPVALTDMRSNSMTQLRDGDSETRTMAEVLFGVTQVIDRYTLAQVNLGFSQSDGYHNDPYKIVSVLDSNGDLIATNGLNGRYIYENRPDARSKQTLFARVKRDISGDVLDVSYRILNDDWGITSHTFDVRYRFNMTSANYWEPHVRYYQQGEADFYRYSLSENEALPAEVSADYRLADMTATTVGLKYGFTTPGGNQNSIRAELYQQSGDNDASSVDAFILQYNYKF
ncbi:DUF3570 domain-containing protein [Bermanella marisrubri]|uniref:DUF3570 domain-containing protein n=1 Tax=Bermanella marisrubri TaxID=207949 RepID=Q1MYE8_9GAMM|nr:DUF3570 domain-containing protein [Bermanella marisrubri]EAT10997.1 hypothetical protein RED65_02208 [Oceanobacter sp. RED65] [Bermanella marisrubri]QIZ83758.1 DUF3570 domain-containing protein [Bermanella marisrubri]